MHLKNFSLYSTKPVNYILTPAYDLLSTKLVLPADSEELALTLNGKEKKIKKSDFVVAMNSIGLEDKIIEILFVCDDVLLVAAAHTVGKIDPGLERPKHER